MKLFRFLGLSVLGLGIVLGMSACDGPASEKLIPKPKFKKKVFKGDVKGQEFFTPQVDILFVVDDSGSMGTHQTNLANGIRTFVDNLDSNSLLEYHFGVITSSDDFSSTRNSGGGNLAGFPPFVDKNTPDGLLKLQENLMVGTSGDATEIFLDVIRMAHSPNLTQPGGRNSGFFRRNAYLAIIFLTDSDDQGNMSAQDLHRFLVDTKGGKEDLVLAYGAIIPRGDSCDRSGEPEPDRIMTFLSLAKGGDYFSLCDLNFGKRLAELANDIVGRVGKYFYLREIILRKSYFQFKTLIHNNS